MEIKDRIKRLRENRNMSQAELANELGISNGLIAMYETGKRYPSRKRLEQIADYFNVSMDYLTGRFESCHLDHILKRLPTVEISQS